MNGSQDVTAEYQLPGAKPATDGCYRAAVERRWPDLVQQLQDPVPLFIQGERIGPPCLQAVFLDQFLGVMFNVVELARLGDLLIDHPLSHLGQAVEFFLPVKSVF